MTLTATEQTHIQTEAPEEPSDAEEVQWSHQA